LSSSILASSRELPPLLCMQRLAKAIPVNYLRIEQ
jgi:hypothetical protein